MTSGQQRSNTSALSEKEATVNAVADSQTYASFVGDIPAFSDCATEVLEEFVTHAAHRVHVAEGETVCSQAQCDENLYVLVAGAASLEAGEGVRVALTAGDFFGWNPGRYHGPSVRVIAEEDVEVLVIQPQDVLRLEMIASRHRHPSKIDWRVEAKATQPPRQRERTLVTT
jgi:signal-transduction protein with cAMP-binding, CBS, and nucleotidyltransferase domain